MEEILRRDLDTSLTMVGKLGEDKWKLEEKARFLEENLALVNEDLVRKTKVIQYYVNKTKLVVTQDQVEKERTNSRKQTGVRGTLLRAGNDQELSIELLSKMEAVLEETVLRNVQLQVLFIFNLLFIYFFFPVHLFVCTFLPWFTFELDRLGNARQRDRPVTE